MTVKILLAGADSFLGSEMARAFFYYQDVSKIYLIPTGSLDADNHEMQITRLFDFWKKSFQLDFSSIQSKVEILSYDLINDRHEKNVDVDVVIHAALSNNPFLTSETAQKINEKSTESILRLCNKDYLKRLVLISSLVGVKSKSSVVDESSQLSFSPLFHHESMVAAEEAVKKSGVPYTIVRLPHTIGRSDSGYLYGTSLLYQFLHYWLDATDFPIWVDDRGSVDVIPADYAVTSLLALMQHPYAVNQVYHLTSGWQYVSPLTFISSAAQFFGVRKPNFKSSMTRSLGELGHHIFSSESKFDRKQTNRNFEFLAKELFAQVGDFIRYGNIYDNRKVSFILDPLKIHCPHFSDYSSNIFRYIQLSNWGSAAASLQDGLGHTVNSEQQLKAG